LLYKAFWGEEEEKKQTKEEFKAELFEAHGKAIEKFTEMRLSVEFKRADELLIERFEEWLTTLFTVFRTFYAPPSWRRKKERRG